jgi:hypothetical protein
MAKKVLSFDEYLETPDVRYTEVETARGVVKLGSVSSDDILEWLEENDKVSNSKNAGLRLLVKSIINPDGSRIPKSKREDAAAALRKQDAFQNGKLVKAALDLNGVTSRTSGDSAKNDSSGTLSGDGRSAQPEPSGKEA